MGGHSKGRIRKTGNHGSGTSGGTSWEVEDSCEGTLFKVTSGKVTVFDFGLNRRMTVRAGKVLLDGSSPRSSIAGHP